MIIINSDFLQRKIQELILNLHTMLVLRNILLNVLSKALLIVKQNSFSLYDYFSLHIYKQWKKFLHSCII